MNETAFEKLGSFFRQFKKLSFKKREMILRAEEEPPGVFYLEVGYVRLYSVCREGEELTLIIFKPEDFFPMMWAINKSNLPYYLEAQTSVELWRAPREKFLAFIRANPDVFFELTSRILVRLGGLLQRMEHLVFGNAYSQVASIVFICAERFGRKEKDGILIQAPLTHKDIANLIGVTRETVSIEMKKLERKNLITHHGRLLLVKSPSGLRKESLLDSS